MSAGRVAALAITTVGLLATTASAQGLGAAAARAAEARKTTGTQPAVKLTDADLPKASVLEAELSSFTINTHVLHRYASARGCIASVRSLTPPVDEALLAAEKAEKDQLTIEGIMRDHAEVLGCFERWRIEAREYTLAHIAFYRAIEDTGESGGHRQIDCRPSVNRTRSFCSSSTTTAATTSPSGRRRRARWLSSASGGNDPRHAAVLVVG